jgi:hypothetical protein
MEADDVLIEYLRGKLKSSRGKRASKILKPPEERPEEESLDMSPEDAAELEGLMGAEGGEPCAKCGADAGTCDC